MEGNETFHGELPTLATLRVDKGNWTGCNSSHSLSALQFGLFLSVFSLISLVGIFGNILVIVAIASDRKMRSVMNLLLFNLACADLGNLLACCLEWSQIFIRDGGTEWLLPPFFCRPVRYLPIIFLYSSLLIQVAVSVERYIAIRYPMQVRLLCTKRNLGVGLICIWTFSSMFAIPYAVLHRTESREDCTEKLACRPSFLSWSLFIPYKLCECLLFYFIPLAVILLLYIRISMVLWSVDSTLQEGQGASGASAAESESLRTRQNVIKMLIVCIAVYFISYSPIQAIFLSKMFGKSFYLGFNARLTLNAFALACSACNPLLYTVFSEKFRKKFAGLLLCRPTTDQNNRRVSRNPTGRLSSCSRTATESGYLLESTKPNAL